MSFKLFPYEYRASNNQKVVLENDFNNFGDVVIGALNVLENTLKKHNVYPEKPVEKMTLKELKQYAKKLESTIKNVKDENEKKVLENQLAFVNSKIKDKKEEKKEKTKDTLSTIWDKLVEVSGATNETNETKQGDSLDIKYNEEKEDKSNKKNKKILIGVGIGVGVLLLMTITIIALKNKKR